MKIAFDHQTFTYQKYGGISRYFSILADKLSINNEVKIFAGAHRNNYIPDLPEGIVSGIKMTNFPPRTSRLFHYVNHSFSQSQIKRWKPDIIHETYYSGLPRFKLKSPSISTVYDMIHEIYPREFSKLDKTTEQKKKTLERVDKIISISHSTKKDLIEIFNIDEKKISVVHLGVDLKLFETFKKFNSKTKEPFILFVGNRGGYKNFNSLLKACSISNQIKNKIKIVAFGGGSFSSMELKLLRNLGYHENYVVQISGDDYMLASLYSNALCLVYPSLYEGFGLPPLEAMASNCPVLASNTSSMPEVINNAGIYFDPLSIEQLSSSIENVIEDEILQDRLIKAGRERIKSFTWEKCVNETTLIYKNLI